MDNHKVSNISGYAGIHENSVTADSKSAETDLASVDSMLRKKRSDRYKRHGHRHRHRHSGTRSYDRDLYWYYLLFYGPWLGGYDYGGLGGGYNYGRRRSRNMIN